MECHSLNDSTESASCSPLPLSAGWAGPGTVLAQTSAPAKPASKSGGKPEGGIFDALFGNMMFPLLLTLLLMYFFLMRPEQRKRKDAEKLLSNLKANDPVVTIGGICGVVTNVTDSYVTIRVDDKTNAKIRVLRSAISRLGTAEDATEDEAKEAKK
jgi:preprotein translocase subunit YajC